MKLLPHKIKLASITFQMKLILPRSKNFCSRHGHSGVKENNRGVKKIIWG
jgi:hypothetical protein